jgi:hypothetical protein
VFLSLTKPFTQNNAKQPCTHWRQQQRCLSFDGFDSDGALNRPGGIQCPVLSGPAGFPQPIFRLIGTALAVLPVPSALDFHP